MLDNSNGLIWMNGKFVSWQEAKIHILTHTLHYGSGVFEGERAYNGKIFKMSEHHQRLHDSAWMLDFKIPYSVEELNQAAKELLKLNNLSNAYLRPVAWHGSEALSVSSLRNSVHVAIAAWKWDSYFPADQKGIKLMWAKWVRPAPNMSPVHAKANGQYIISTLSKNKAEGMGFQDALMLDYRGYIAECTSANVFMVKNGILSTPIADCFLNGITRKTIIELAHASHIPFIEKYIMPSEILLADEVFVTGTAAEVQPVIQIGEKKFELGSITQHLASNYKNLVTDDFNPNLRP
jgi:branched-chain amino acid aminotransferase group I